MRIREVISRVYQWKGKRFDSMIRQCADMSCSFGWTNASYVHGLKLLDDELLLNLKKGVEWENIHSPSVPT